MSSEPNTLTKRATRSEAVEDYTKAIYGLQQHSPDGVSTSAIAQRLGVSVASTSAMVKKLTSLGLVAHSRYGSVELTESGEKIALEVIRHHRLLELYLSQDLGLPWDRVHDEAEVLEHVLSEELEQLIAEKLGNPTHDPHGDPIPTPELEVKSDRSERLDRLNPGDRGQLVRVSDSDPEMLRYLDDLGISLGDSFEVVSREPFDGPLNVRFGKKVHALGGALTRAMQVEK